MTASAQYAPQSASLSRYVRRCVKCRVVRGNSAFGGRWSREPNVCRFCAESETIRAKKVRALVRQLSQLQITERRLAHRLEAIRAQIRTAEAAAIAQEQTSLFPANRATRLTGRDEK